MDQKSTKRISYFFLSRVKPILLFLIIWGLASCTLSTGKKENPAREAEPGIVVKKREDGTISSVNQVNAYGRVHGTRATYYADGKTLYSKLSFVDGKKHGPAAWYYTNGQVFKLTNFEDGKHQGLTRIYYRDGSLSAEFESDRGHVLPGLKEFLEDGSPVSEYPEIQFREIDHLASHNRVDLQVYCTKRNSGVRFFVLKEEHGEADRIYLITKNDSALLQYYVNPGERLDQKVVILAELPTELGNTLARKYSYQLNVSH